jgi:hypothetical protein
VQTPVVKEPPTGNRRGRPRATEVIAKTNHKVDQFFQKKTAQVDASMPLQPAEEEKQQSQPYQDQLPPQMPEEEKKYTGSVNSECRLLRSPRREPS